MSNQSIIQKGQKCVMNTYGRFPIALVKGRGCRVWDADGKSYLDFVGGIATCSLGHAHPGLISALQEQSQKLWHVSNLYWIEPQVELAAKLCTASGLDRAFFCNSGTEANEAAIKLARKYFRRKGEDRWEIITFKNSFHGRTTGSLAATGQTKYQQGFEPLMPGFSYAVFNDLQSVKDLTTTRTCAVMIEVVQGEGGVNVADPDFIKGLETWCREQGILLIIDEVQTGMGRTGRFFAFQHYGIKPDIITLAKALGGGFPIGAMLASEEAATGFAPGDHASTFGGNPLACAVGARMVDILSGEGFLDNVVRTGEYLKSRLKGIVGKESRAVEVRGLGLLVGVEFKTEVKGLIDICIEKGLLLVGAGPNKLRFAPPLNIGQAEVDEAVGILEEALQEWQI